MQIRFRHELNVVNAGVKSKKGAPLSSVTRGTNIAGSSRSIVKLNVTSLAQANNLVKFSKHAKALGNGLALINFSSRVGSIHNSYKAGEKWERELFIESSSFAASATVGVISANVGVSALGFLMVATPVGWVGLVIGGLAVAGVTPEVSMGTNTFIKENAGSKYYELMRWLTK